MPDYRNLGPGSYHTLGLRSTPSSTSDLFSPTSIHGPFFMPSASRRQRRASLVRDAIANCYVTWFVLQQDIGFGKLQSYVKLDKLGEVSS